MGKQYRGLKATGDAAKWRRQVSAAKALLLAREQLDQLRAQRSEERVQAKLATEARELDQLGIYLHQQIYFASNELKHAATRDQTAIDRLMPELEARLGSILSSGHENLRETCVVSANNLRSSDVCPTESQVARSIDSTFSNYHASLGEFSRVGRKGRSSRCLRKPPRQDLVARLNELNSVLVRQRELNTELRQRFELSSDEDRRCSFLSSDSRDRYFSSVKRSCTELKKEIALARARKQRLRSILQAQREVSLSSGGDESHPAGPASTPSKTYRKQLLRYEGAVSEAFKWVKGEVARFSEEIVSTARATSADSQSAELTSAFSDMLPLAEIRSSVLATVLGLFKDEALSSLPHHLLVKATEVRAESEARARQVDSFVGGERFPLWQEVAALEASLRGQRALECVGETRLCDSDAQLWLVKREELESELGELRSLESAAQSLDLQVTRARSDNEVRFSWMKWKMEGNTQLLGRILSFSSRWNEARALSRRIGKSQKRTEAMKAELRVKESQLQSLLQQKSDTQTPFSHQTSLLKERLVGAVSTLCTRVLECADLSAPPENKLPSTGTLPSRVPARQLQTLVKEAAAYRLSSLLAKTLGQSLTFTFHT